MKKSLFLLISLVVAFAIAYSQSKPDKQLDEKLDELLSKQFPANQPGCAVLVAKKGAIVYKKSFGLASMELNVPMQPDMVFNIASITKQYTAVAILQLVEQGKISLQDSLQKFIADYPFKGHTITIENLLTHTSGIKDYLQIDFRGTNMERWDFSPKQLIDSFKNYPLQFEPGTKFSYSNSGYYLLGYIIEKVTGQSYQVYMQEKILRPPGLTHTYFDQAGAIIPNRVSGYSTDQNKLKNADFWSPTIEYAAGGLISNVEDMYKWHQALYAGKLVTKETLQKAFTPYRLKDGTSSAYGYGWFIQTTNGVKSIEHEGGLPGFVSNEVYYPDSDVFIATLYNSSATPVNELSLSIAGIALGKALQTDIKVDPKLLEDYVGTYRLTIDTSRTMTMIKENDHLVAQVSPTQTIPLLFQSDTKFQFKNLLNANCEFIRENGKVVKFSVEQNGKFEWVKVK